MRQLRLVLADDQVLFLQSLKRVLEISAPDLEIVGLATDGREAVELCERSRPDVILLDVRMPNMDGVEATRIIHERFPEVQILVLTTFDDDRYVENALRYGARGYLLKDIPPDDLINSVRMIDYAPILMAQKVMRNLIEKIKAEPVLSGDRIGAQESAARLATLSNREREILRLVLREQDNKAIAAALFIAEQTVRNHISEIYTKLGAHSRLQLLRGFKECLPELERGR